VVPGVILTRVGYTGGSVPDPTYRKLFDHTESVDLDYDPSKIDYSTLLKMFWQWHDPTVDHKRQYMSAIFYHDDAQKKLAEESLKAEQAKRKRPIATQILAHETFYEAEDYHQKYLLRSQPKLFRSLGLDGSELIKSHVAARLNGFCGGYGSVEQLEHEMPLLGVGDSITNAVRDVMAHGSNATCGM